MGRFQNLDHKIIDIKRLSILTLIFCCIFEFSDLQQEVEM